MKKLKLDLDDLQVESFQTTPEAKEEGQGTVVGYITQDLTLCEECTSLTCGSTCGNTCGSTCGNTCGSTCGSSCGGTCQTCSFSCNGGCNGPTCTPGCTTDFLCFICTDFRC